MSSCYKANIIKIQSFYSAILKNRRALNICLPPSYRNEPDRYYPVLYMQDGQNIFSGETSYSGSGWEIHRVAEDLASKGGIPELIIVGIAHKNQHRLSEYAHWDGEFQGKPVRGRGLLYEAFLINEVKPYIEEHLRVQKGPENTGIMGSSMGGLVSFMIAIRNPEIFGKAGVLSPSFWWGGKGSSYTNKKITKNIKAIKNSKKAKNQLPLRLWLDMGKAEGEFSKGFDEVLKAIGSHSAFDKNNMAVWKVPEAIHSEVDWMHRVHCPLLHLFGETGNPQELFITGRSIIGLGEEGYGLDVTGIFDTGLAITPEQVIFETSDPEVLRISEDGEVIPIKCGSSVIRGKWMGLEAYREFKVVSELSSKVTVKIHVLVSAQGEEESPEPLYIGVTGPKDYSLKKTEEGYFAILNLDRDSVLSYKITGGTWNRVEKGAEGQDIPSRRLTASEDLTVKVLVEGW